MGPQVEDSNSGQKLEQRANPPPPARASGGSTALPTPGFQPSGFEDCETMNLGCVQPPWELVMAAWEGMARHQESGLIVRPRLSGRKRWEDPSAMRVTWEPGGGSPFGSCRRKTRSQHNEPVLGLGKLPGSVCTPGHVLSCLSQGVILPRWEVIPHKVSEGYDWQLNPITLTCSRRKEAKPGPVASSQKHFAHRIDGHKSQGISLSGFLLTFFIRCRILVKSARKQNATASLFSISGAVGSCPPLSAWTPALRQRDRLEPSGVVHVTHASYCSVCQS